MKIRNAKWQMPFKHPIPKARRAHSSYSILNGCFGRKASEGRKIIWSKNFGEALIRCWIHVVPVSAVIIVASLNLKGYFIGDTYLGSQRATVQKLDVLGLQVAAKLLELLIGSSLGLTIMDILQCVLTRSDNGLPLGMITAETSFKEIKYFFSSRFWRGVRGLSQQWQRWLITIWILASGIIVALAGPSTAVLILPTARSGWPAGAAFFHLVGNSSTLFPPTLDSESDGGPLCRSPSTESLEAPHADYLGCPWAGYSTLLSTYTQWGDDLFIYPANPVSFDEYGQTRELIQHIRAPGHTPESWAVASQPGINLWSGSISIAWNGAAANVPPLSSAANFKYGSTMTVYVPTVLPAVRSVCHYQNASQHATNLSFPLLEPFKTWSGELFVLPKIDLPKSSIDTDTGPVWISVPTTQVSTSDGDSVKLFASALLVSQIPQSVNSIPASIMTCSIDARWAPGKIVNSGTNPLVPVLDPAHLRVPSGKESSYNEADGFLPKDDGSWQSILLDTEWLDALTPSMESRDGNQTSLTTLFEVIGLINGTSIIPDIDLVYNVAANAIATLVADGISRVGVHYQAGNPTISACRIDPHDSSAFLLGNQENPSYTYPPPAGVSAANQTQMRWYRTISGLSYKADNSASQLALSLLFIYTAMVLTHTTWVIWTRYSSEAWGTTTELMILAKNSTPAQSSLANTCGGVRAGSTWSKRARVRVAGEQKLNIGGEELHVLINDDTSDRDDDYEKVEPDVEYGQARNRKAGTV